MVDDGRLISHERFLAIFALIAAAALFGSFPKMDRWAIGSFTVTALLLIWLFTDRKTKVYYAKK